MNTFVLREDKDVVDDNTNHQGARMVFLNMNSIDILEELRMLMMIMTHLSRDFMKMQSISGDIKSKNDEAKGFWNHGYEINSESSSLFEVNDKTRKIDVSLAHRRKLCSGNKDHVAQFKI